MEPSYSKKAFIIFRKSAMASAAVASTSDGDANTALSELDQGLRSGKLGVNVINFFFVTDDGGQAIVVRQWKTF